MVDLSAHPQHMNGLKRFVNVWSGCGSHSMWVWSLNYCTLISFVVSLWPRKSANSLKFLAYKNGASGVMVDPSALPQHRNGLKLLLYVWSGCRNHLMWVWGLNHCTLTSCVASLWHRKSANSLNSVATSMVVVAWWWTNLPIHSHSIWMISNTLYMYEVDVGTIPCGFWASTNPPLHHL